MMKKILSTLVFVLVAGWTHTQADDRGIIGDKGLPGNVVEDNNKITEGGPYTERKFGADTLQIMEAVRRFPEEFKKLIEEERSLTGGKMEILPSPEPGKKSSIIQFTFTADANSKWWAMPSKAELVIQQYYVHVEPIGVDAPSSEEKWRSLGVRRTWGLNPAEQNGQEPKCKKD